MLASRVAIKRPMAIIPITVHLSAVSPPAGTVVASWSMLLTLPSCSFMGFC